MREAREVAGLNLAEASRRLNRDLGCSIITAALLELWEIGRERPDAVVFLLAVRMAGAEAVQILASLAT